VSIVKVHSRLNLKFGRELPMYFQVEAAECGLACIAMVASFHGYRTDLQTLRRKHEVSLKGTTFAHLMQIANLVGLSSRAVKLDLDGLPHLRLPCVLHWSFSHFVVLGSVGKRSVTLHDPAVGIRNCGMEEFSRLFTGVALEVWPSDTFILKEVRSPVRVWNVAGKIIGLARSLTQIVVLALALEVFSLASPLFLQWTVDDVIVSADKSLLTTLALGFGLLIVLRAAVSAVRAWAILYMQTTISVQWRANIFNHLLSLPVRFFERRQLGDIATRFNSVDDIQQTLTTSFLEGLLDGLMSIVTLIVMFVYAPNLSWIVLAASALYFVIRLLRFKPILQATLAKATFAAKQQTQFFETVRGAKSIKLFQREGERRSVWMTHLIDQINAGLRADKLRLVFDCLNSLLSGAEMIVVIWLGAKMVIGKEFTVGALMAFSAYKDQFDRRSSSLIDKIFQAGTLQVYVDRLSDIVLAEPEEANAVISPRPGTALSATISVSGLRFRYAEQDPYVLDGVSFEIAEGESVALIGPSGGGKSTLLNVMLGVYQPTEGDVLIGGISIKQIGIAALRQMVGVVMQDDTLFAGSILENITFFDANPDPVWAEECAKAASIHQEICEMPMGFNSLIGDLGSALSGGQKQRVLLARALYKRPKILLLDEATSHLDLEREKKVSDSIRRLNITRLIVAHRPETAASADRRIRLEHGKIVTAVRAVS
jgi:ATP-binding cassette, subfamily B, bacterial CvaB/MchF/RaxB